MFVFSDSVLFPGGRNSAPSSLCENFVKRSGNIGSSRRPEYRELSDIAGDPIVLEWNISQGHTARQLLLEVEAMMPEDWSDPLRVNVQ